MAHRTLLLAVSAVIMVADPVLAQNGSTPAAAPSTADSTAAKEKLTCRKVAVTGSRIGKKRVCATAEEWDRIDRKNQGGVDDVLENKGTGVILKQ
jgi:hypothetical protein